MSKLDLNYTQNNFDATRVYPCPMFDKSNVYPKTDTGFAFEPPMNDTFVNDFIFETYNQDGNDSESFIKNDTTNQILNFNNYRFEKKLKK